jgi:hypothetical protein
MFKNEPKPVTGASEFESDSQPTVESGDSAGKYFKLEERSVPEGLSGRE